MEQIKSLKDPKDDLKRIDIAFSERLPSDPFVVEGLKNYQVWGE